MDQINTPERGHRGFLLFEAFQERQWDTKATDIFFLVFRGEVVDLQVEEKKDVFILEMPKPSSGQEKWRFRLYPNGPPWQTGKRGFIQVWVRDLVDEVPTYLDGFYFDEVQADGETGQIRFSRETENLKQPSTVLRIEIDGKIFNAQNEELGAKYQRLKDKRDKLTNKGL